jgi:hypothetical protein
MEWWGEEQVVITFASLPNDKISLQDMLSLDQWIQSKINFYSLEEKVFYS